MTKFEHYVVSRLPDGSPSFRGSDEWQTICPSCHHHGRKAFINTRTGLSQCKHCPWKTRSQIGLVMWLEGMGYRQAQEWWDQQTEFDAYVSSIRQSDRTHLPRRAMIQELPEGFNFLTGREQANPYLNYLLWRGVSLEQIQYHQIGYCEVGRYAQRVIVPVVNQTLEYFCDRLIISDATRLKTVGVGQRTAAWPVLRSTVLFNLKAATCLWQQTGHPIWLCEGPFDALSLGSCGVALLGKECSRHQFVRLLETGCQTFVIALDPDASRKAYELAGRLAVEGIDVWICPVQAETGDINKYHQAGISLPSLVQWNTENRLNAILGERIIK